jgi:antitoxin PrlF
MRTVLGWQQDEPLHVRVDGARLIIERPEDAVAQLRLLGKGVPLHRSLVDELLAERRAAAASE